MARKGTQIKDTTRNKRFAVAFTYLKGKYKEEFGTNIKLAEKMGVDDDSITNVVHCHTAVTDNFIASFQEATGGMFNVHYLRGESDVMLAADLKPVTDQPSTALDPVVAALLAEKDVRIAEKDETIELLKRERAEMTAEKDAHIADLRQQVDSLRLQLAAKKGLTEIGRSRSERAEQGSVSPHAGE